jgi:tetratricopeptide (TPR) repeat protein
MRRDAIAMALLVLLTAATFSPIRHAPFIDYDDDEYVTSNAHIREGLSADGALWALTSAAAANWHPLTWLSHMLDVELWGLNPRPMHIENVFVHALNVGLVFLVLRAMTGRFWPAVAAAGLWGLHPLRVESVAWIAERKDLLSTAFFLLTILAYVWYAARPSVGRYLLVVAAFAMALMSKPMVVTLPAVLLLIDAWPLQRAGLSSRRGWGRLLAEKMPLAAMSIAVALVTLLVQTEGGAVRTQRHPFTDRLANAAVAYVRYLGKTIYPVDLSIFYPYPRAWGSAAVVGAAATLLTITALAVWQARGRPYLLVGWLFFLGTMVPVVGLFVHVGEQSMADRYTYIPGIGLSLMVVWLAADLRERLPAIAAPVTAGVCIAVVLALLTIRQIGYWREGTLGLFQHALDVTSDNWLAHSHVGSQLVLLGPQRWPEAERHFRRAIELDPSFGEAHYNLGNLMQRQGRQLEAIEQYAVALRVNPMVPEVWFNRGQAELLLGRTAAGIQSLEMALQLAPVSPAIRRALDQAKAGTQPAPEGK